MEKHLPVRLLSTRALGNAARDYIRHEQWQADIVGMIELHGVPVIDRIKTFFADYESNRENLVLIFSSENAVKWLKWALEKFGFTFPQEIRAVSVGEKTMQAAREHLRVVPVLSEKNSSLLLEAIGNAFSTETVFSFFCGNRRVEILPAGLKAKGFSVNEYIVYETALTPHKIVKEYDAVLFFSPSAVDSFFKVNTWRREMMAVSIGHSTSAALCGYGVEKILVADEPNETSMLKKLHDYLPMQP